jgi:hypothetical protein
LTTGGQAGAYGKLHDPLVQHGQDAGKTGADRTGILIGLGAEFGRTAAKDLGIGQKLRVDL